MRRKIFSIALAGLVSTTLTVPSTAGAVETIHDEDGTSIVSIASGESISVEQGKDIGVLLEEQPSSGYQYLSGRTAPDDCIKVETEGVAIQVYNECDSDMRVKVIMTANTSPVIGAKDSACTTVPAGQRTNIRWVIRGHEKVDRVELC